MSHSAPRTFFDKAWDDHFIAKLGDDADLLQIDRWSSTSSREARRCGRWPKPGANR